MGKGLASSIFGNQNSVKERAGEYLHLACLVFIYSISSPNRTRLFSSPGRLISSLPRIKVQSSAEGKGQLPSGGAGEQVIASQIALTQSCLFYLLTLSRSSAPAMPGGVHNLTFGEFCSVNRMVLYRQLRVSSSF